MTAEFGAANYTAIEGRGAVTITVTLSADPERSVTIPITVTENGGAGNGDYTRSATSVTIDSGDTSATFTVTATDDDVYDGDGNDESLALGFGAPLPDGVSRGTRDTATVGLIDNEVLMGSDAVPPILKVGDKFRLLFVTSGERDPASSDIADYNAFVQAAAAEGRSGIRAYSSQFRVLGSTAAVSALDNTATNYTSSNLGVPIYWLDGPRAADEYGDFYDGSWDHRDPGRDEDGDAVHFSTTDTVYTGTRANGTTSSSAPLGGDDVKVARPGSGAGNEIAYGNRRDPGSRTEPFYGLSFVLHAVVPADTPYVTGVEVASPPSGGEYFAGDTIKVAVTFSEEVDVTGTPTFPLRIGSNTRNAGYQDDESTATRLVFAYVVADDDSDADGIASRGRALGVPPGSAIARQGVSTVAAYAGPIGLDTDLRVIPAVKAEFAAASYTAAEGGSAVTVKVNLDPQPAREVVITISATTNDGATGADYTLSTTSLTFDSDENTASFTVSATKDDDDDGGESLILGFESLSDAVSPGGTQDTATVILLNIPATVEVPADWDLIPSGVDTGGRFRLLFVTSDRRNAASSNIAVYNSFVRAAAAGGHDDIQAYSDHFAVLGSTGAVDARNNTGTHGGGVPIYWLNGPRAANNYRDFYDDSWDHVDPVRFESGATGHLTDDSITNRVWTGTGSDGLRAGNGSNTLGSSRPEFGSPGQFGYAGNVIAGATANPDYQGFLYGLSFVFQVAPSDDADLSDLTVNGASVPDVAACTTGCTHTVGNATARVTVVAVKSNDNAQVAYSTTDADNGTAGHQMDLEVGNNEVTITVTAQDGVATQTYTLTIVRTALEVEFAAASYTAAEGAGAVTVTVNLSTDPERTVALPISVTPNGAGGGDYTLSTTSLTFNSGDTSAAFTVTAVDDEVLDGDVESLTLGLETLPDGWSAGTQNTTTVSLFDNEIPITSRVVPFGTAIGGAFRLLFVTSGQRDATSSDIADYNAFVQAAAAAGHADIQDYSGQFRALASTATVDAIDNTATNYTSDDRGVVIWWLTGSLDAADSYMDFYDGSWDFRDPGRDENGDSVDFEQNASGRVWTGTMSDGTASSHPLGSSVPHYGEPAYGVGKELFSGGSRPATNAYRLYGLSFVLHAAPPANRPYVTGVEAVEPPASGVYRSGDTIKVAVTFSEEVAVSGAPTFTLFIGRVSDVRNAAYQDAESTARRLVFTHLVTNADIDDDGISSANSLSLPSGATITRKNDDSVAAYVRSIVWDPDLKVNEAPRITNIAVTSRSVATPNPNNYGRGEDIEFTVTFSAPVRVTGDVEFRFVILNAEPRARLADGDGTTKLVFVYTVRAGERDYNGIAIFGSSDRRPPLTLTQGQSITDAVSGRNADLTHAAPNSLGLPTIDGSLTGADATLSRLELSLITLDQSFSPGVTQYTASADAFVGSITVTATPSQNTPNNEADVVITPLDDFVVPGHQVALGTGDTIITVNVTSTNGRSMRTYTITVTREADSTPPSASSAKVSENGTTIDIVFDEDLDTSGSPPAASAFQVTVGSASAVNPSSVDFHATAATTVVLDMGTANTIAAGEMVSVAYTKPTANPLKDAADNEVESFTGQATLNRAAADTKVSWAAASYAALEGHPGTTVTLALSAAPTGDVTVMISFELGGGAEDADYSGVPTSVTFDSASALDADGRPTESFVVVATDDGVVDPGETVTLSFGTPLPSDVTAGTQSTAMVSLVDNDIPFNSSLAPAGTAIGDGFRLLFVTSGKRKATSADIADYNDFVQRAAASGHADIQDYSGQFQALASTASRTVDGVEIPGVDARDNTATNPDEDGTGVPIWWLNGPRAANNYDDFYDDTWDHQDPGRNQAGGVVDFGDNDNVWTGTDKDGTARRPLGGSEPAAFGRPPESEGALFYGFSAVDFREPLYALSYVLYAAAPVDTPYVTGVEAVDPPRSAYRSGDTIRLEVTFSEDVMVSGEPTFPLSIGNDTRQAQYQDTESTSRVLVFTHLVTDDDYDNDTRGISNAELELVLPTNTSITRQGDNSVDGVPRKHRVGAGPEGELAPETHRHRDHLHARGGDEHLRAWRGHRVHRHLRRRGDGERRRHARFLPGGRAVHFRWQAGQPDERRRRRATGVHLHRGIGRQRQRRHLGRRVRRRLFRSVHPLGRPVHHGSSGHRRQFDAARAGPRPQPPRGRLAHRRRRQAVESVA